MKLRKITNLLLRALKVFVQVFIRSFVSSVVLRFASMGFAENDLKTLLAESAIFACVTGIFAVWNSVLTPLIRPR